MRTSWIFACVVLLFTVASASAQTTVLPAGDASGSDWPQWAGPYGNYTSPEKGLLREWPADGPKVLWRAKISQGWGCPSIMGNDVVYAGSIRVGDSDGETIVCLDATTGREKWHYDYALGGYYYQWYVGWPWGGVRATPFITEKYIYSIGAIGKLVCLDRKGNLVWENDLGKVYWPYMASKQYHEWKGAFFSPIVSEGVVIVPYTVDILGNGNRCAGIDAETGKQKWIYPADQQLPGLKDTKCNPGSGTPFLATFGKDRCAVMFNYYPCQLLALRLSDGKKVWEFNDELHNGQMQTAYLLGDQIIINNCLNILGVTTDFKNAPFAAKTTYVAEYRSSYHGVVPSGNAFYGLSVGGGAGDPNNLPGWDGTLICADRATGKHLWEQKGFKSGISMIGADGLLFARSFQSLFLIEASPKGYFQKGKVEKLHDVTNANGKDGGWVMPVLSRGKLYVRTPTELICYKVTP